MTHSSLRPALAQWARRLGAAATVATGADHLYEYTANHFSTVPTIGTLFLLNFIAATVVGIGLLVPATWLPGRAAAPVRWSLALAGVGIGATSLVSLWISEHSSLFGFSDHGYRTTIVVAIIAESVAVVSLAAYLIVTSPHPRRLATRSG